MEQKQSVATEGMSVHTLRDSSTGRLVSEPTTSTIGIDVESSEFFTANEASQSNTEELVVSSSEPTSTSSSEYFSTRIQTMMERRSEFSSDLKAAIEASRDHWSEVESASDEEDVAGANLEAFQSLQKQFPGGFFQDWGHRSHEFELGRKIGEGAQAEIFELKLIGDDKGMGNHVLKVFKEGSFLRALQKQWPLGMLKRSGLHAGELWAQSGVPAEGLWALYTSSIYSCAIYGGVLLKSRRFAFWMLKYWGDLRTLIDRRMKQNHNQGPPFKEVEVDRIMYFIASGMQYLHMVDVTHRDLKASNILIHSFVSEDSDPVDGRDDYSCLVADYESSVGVLGTGFWRVPEILDALKNCNMKPLLFTKESDVYSYGMTCYEILTGRIPFEGFRFSDYDAVLRGDRPKLPTTIKPWIKEMLHRCWHPDPHQRPTSTEVVNIMKGHLS